MAGRKRRGGRRTLALVTLTIGALALASAASGTHGGDHTPPSITLSLSPSSPDGSNGWYRSDVGVTWTVNDPESAITSTTGCTDTTLTSTATVSCSATSEGGTANVSQQVKIDKTPPVLNVPANITETTNDSTGKVVSFTVSASEGTVSCSHSSGAKYPVGTTNVSCTATDPAGNTDSGGFSITLNFVDNTPPVVADHGPVAVEATSPSGGTANYTPPTATDNVDPNPTVTCSPPPGAAVALGSHTVSCTARDNANNTSAPKTFNLVVVDTTPPTLGAMPANQTVQATSPAGATASYATPGATDVVDTTPTVTCTPAPGSTLTVASHTVTCTATDDSGNTSASGSFTIAVVDTVAPTLGTMPANITANASSASGAVVSFTAPGGTDAVGPVTVTCTPGSGSTFPVGATTVSCTATDGAGNTSAPGTFTVTVSDTTAPTIAARGDVTAEATSAGGTPVTYSAPAASDNVTASPTVSCSPASGASFPLGTTTVTCTARDAAGNQGTGSFSVVVVDKTAPVVSVPENRTLEASGPGGATTFYTVGATDLGEPLPPSSVSCNPPSGSTFGLGTTTVTCSATDPRGNAGSASFKVTVSDNTPPIVFAPETASFFADSPAGISSDHPVVSRVLSSAGAQDVVDESPSVRHNAPQTFPLGETIVVFTASDDSGNTATVRMKVTVTVRPASQPTGQPANPNVDVIPPQNVRGLAATSIPGVITLRWQPVAEAEQYEVYRMTNERTTQSNHNGTLVYRGKATRFEDRRTTAGVEYRYTVIAVDKAGNKAVGEVVVALAKKLLLLSPRFGARSAKPPALVVASVSGATYYNIQLFRNGQKILSVWPAGTRYQLPLTWKYGGKAYRLSPGVYRWYAWPGLGQREAARYGEVMGESTFTIVATKPAVKSKKGSKAKPKTKSAAKTKKAKKR